MARRARTLSGPSVSMLDLYGVYTSQPKIGSSVTLPLQVGQEGAIVEAVPTLRNLAWHFGLFEAVTEQVRLNILHKIPLGEENIKALEWYRKSVIFERMYVMPLRRELEASEQYPFWFYCVPRGEVFTKDEVTGELKISGAGEMPLTLLPKKAEMARVRYRVEEPVLYVLAAQIGWLITRLSYQRKFLSCKEAIAALGDWLRYLMPGPKSLVEEKIAGILPA